MNASSRVGQLFLLPDDRRQRAARRARLLAALSLPSFEEQVPFPVGDHVGEHAAGAQSEQRDRDRQEREVVIENDRKDAGERKFEQQRRQRSQGHAQVELRPVQSWGLAGETFGDNRLSYDSAGLEIRELQIGFDRYFRIRSGNFQRFSATSKPYYVRYWP